MLKLDTVIGSGEKAASAVILAQPGALAGILMATDGTNAVTLDIYDKATAATGAKLIATTVVPTSATNRSWSLSFAHPKRCENGIYVVVTPAGGGTCAYVVDYIPGGELQ